MARACACDELSRAVQQDFTPAGCSKSSSSKAAASNQRWFFQACSWMLTYDGSNQSPATRVEHGLSNSLHLSLGELPRLPFTARIERAQFHRARSASKKGTWPLPPLLADFFSILLHQIRLRNSTDNGGSVTASEWGSP